LINLFLKLLLILPIQHRDLRDSELPQAVLRVMMEGGGEGGREGGREDGREAGRLAQRLLEAWSRFVMGREGDRGAELKGEEIEGAGRAVCSLPVFRRMG
jgi:hypothetical protein